MKVLQRRPDQEQACFSRDLKGLPGFGGGRMRLCSPAFFCSPESVQQILPKPAWPGTEPSTAHTQKSQDKRGPKPKLPRVAWGRETQGDKGKVEERWREGQRAWSRSHGMSCRAGHRASRPGPLWKQHQAKEGGHSLGGWG